MDFYKDGANWDANCEEVGLVGYADPDINVVRENVFDSIRFFLETDDVGNSIKYANLCASKVVAQMGVGVI